MATSWNFLKNTIVKIRQILPHPLRFNPRLAGLCVELVLTVEICSMNQDLNDENLINGRVLVRTGKAGKNFKS